MRRLLLALPFALLPLAIAQAADEHDHDHEHGSLGAHEHGVGRLNAVLDGQALELEFDSPAMNLVGFEHMATSAADKAKVAAARKQLENPLALFNLPKAAGCVISTQELNSPLFGDKPEADHDDDDDHDHDAKDARPRTSSRPQRNPRPLPIHLRHADRPEQPRPEPSVQDLPRHPENSGTTDRPKRPARR